MKKQMTAVLAGIMLCTAAPSALAADKKVEIEFQVGESSLSINQQKVEVETPYVVDGVTLVPIRVITEAFGAEVLWNAQERSITLNYSDVTILLHLDSKTAYLNGQAMELLAAPTLSGDTTMIPLRFITENFGADVSYQEDTKNILVVKEMTDSNSIKDYSMILKRTDKERLGDGYLNWSMKRMPSMKLDFRSFDGMNNLFSNETLGAEIRLEILPKEEEMTLDSFYQKLRDALGSVSVQKLERSKTPSGTEYIHAIYKDRANYIDDRVYIYQDKVYYLELKVDIDTEKSEFDHLSADMDSFDFTFSSADAENLSDVDTKTNMHTYRSEDLGIQIDIPGQFTVLQSEDKINSVLFYDFNSGDDLMSADRITFDVYSKEAGHDAKSWADADRKNNRNDYNPDFAEYSEVEKISIAGYDAYCYTARIQHSDSARMLKDAFFDMGDYFYNVSVEMKQADEAKINQIFDSLKLDGVDADKVGILLRTDEQSKSINYKTYKMDANGMTFEAPANWNEASTSPDMVLYSQTGVIVVTLYNKSVTGYQDVGTLMHDLTQSVKDDASCTLDSNRSYPTIDKKNAAHYSYTQKMDDATYVHYVYLIDDKGYMVILDYIVSQIYDGTNSQQIQKKLVDTVKFSS